MTTGFQIVRQRDGQVISQPLRIADSFLRRLRGLLGCDGLNDREGLLIRPCRDVHTFWMKFPIDIVFLDDAMRVVGLRVFSPPGRLYFGGRKARHVLELAGGIIEATGLQVGDRLVFNEVADNV